ncbi:hypothetical protein GCM10009677_21050 [Sphaerisporangium rubeum]
MEVQVSLGQGVERACHLHILPQPERPSVRRTDLPPATPDLVRPVCHLMRPMCRRVDPAGTSVRFRQQLREAADAFHEVVVAERV